MGTMTDEAKALVEKLRDDLPQTLIEKHWVDDNDAIYKQREEAADLIETQAREIERLRWVLVDVTASLVAAISLLERGGKAVKKTALSDLIFNQMVRDYTASVERARTALGDSHDQ